MTDNHYQQGKGDHGMKTLPVTALRHEHIGALVEAAPRTDEGVEVVRGLVRWYTVTSDEVVVAIEEGPDEDAGSGAEEWRFSTDAELTLIRERRY
jgi:hypothetical protein